ncbi:unnamed protein product [Sphagnum jensenii]|uniref:Uncharacterized protein n=1 Tax=Sphagnum jensenii TaxID=128206 RepID=A0ABP1ASK5_9BRYO
MEAQGQRVEEGFPGYRGLTLPRATRSSRGRGDATAQRQSSFGGSSGFFELLATVAGQFLQDPVSEDNESVSKRNASPGSPLMGFPVHRSDSITPLEGEIIKMEWYPSNQIQESLSTKEVVCQQIVEDKKLTALVSVEMDILQPVCEKKGLTELTRQNVGSADNLAGSFECSESLGELKAGQDSEQEAETRIVVEQTGNPGMDLKCNTNMQDGNVVKAEKAIDLAKGREEEYISMGMEDKCMIVDSKNCCPEVTSKSCRLRTQGAVDVESTMAMPKKTVPKRECRVIRNKIKEHRSSQHLLPESMVKIAKDAYSKVRKARKAAKVVKRNCVFGTRSKRKHTDMELTDNSRSSEASFTRQRTTRGLPAKRKRMLDGSVKPSTELHVNTNNLMEMGYEFVDGKPLAAAAKLRSGTYLQTFLAIFAMSDQHVELSIKSFTVPELFVDLPETATVSSLKRAVMDAAMNLLGGGLHVRVLMQGKKVPDEAATLSQMGISCSTKPESLGFMLEPSPVPTSPSGTSEDPLLVLSRAVKHPSPWYSTRVPSAGALAAIHAQADANRRAKNELEIPSPLPNLTYDNIEGDPGAMILHPTVGTGDFPGMSLVPVQPKSSPLDIGKRRVRRPFSVTEVEALVHAVEKLGIGRWRDVKLRAFNQAKHRTYVDLKDKWKTLVHTARIAPHQRRGEPVPQELLERVTRAHTFWSVQEGK